MADLDSFKKLLSDNIISQAFYETLYEAEKTKKVSVFYELKTILYCGILLLTAGLGIIIYKNINSISQIAVVISITAASFFSFAYCFRKSGPFCRETSKNSSIKTDYVLLLASLLLIILIGYVQYQYQVFGSRWGLTTFVSAILLFCIAYYFDHLGVLSMAIVNLAAWAGISITPLHLLQKNDFSNASIILTSICVGLLLELAASLSRKINVKAHFYFTYKNFGIHLLFIGLLAAMIHFSDWQTVWFTILIGITVLEFNIALSEKSFYLMTISLLYFYIGLSYVIIRKMDENLENENLFYAITTYFIISAVVYSLILFKLHKKILPDERL